MAFVDKVDKIEKMEQRMWKAAGMKAKEKKKLLRGILNPKNYKWGILGMVGYFMGTILSHLLYFGGQVISILCARAILFDFGRVDRRSRQKN